MTTSVRRLEIRIDQTGQAAGGIKGLSSGLGGLASTATKVAIGGVAVLGAATVALGSKLLGAGSDAEEMQAKFDTVFKTVGGAVTKELNEFAAAVGRDKFELRGMAAELGDLFKPMGFAEQEAGDLSVQMVRLATDLSSFNNMEMDEALQRLRGTLVGSHENALAFGVVINENVLKAELAANGWDKLTGAALEQAKVQARLNLLMRGTTDAQGDAERTSGGWANQMRRLESIFSETAAEVGLKLLPVFTPLLKNLGDLAADIAPRVVDIFANKVVPTLQSLFEIVRYLATGDFRGGIFGLYEDHPFILFLFAARNLIERLRDAVRSAMDVIMPVLQGFTDWIRDTAMPALTRFLGAFQKDLDTHGLTVAVSNAATTILGELSNLEAAAGQLLTSMARNIVASSPQARAILQELNLYAWIMGEEKFDAQGFATRLADKIHVALTSPATLDAFNEAGQSVGRGIVEGIINLFQGGEAANLSVPAILAWLIQTGSRVRADLSNMGAEFVLGIIQGVAGALFGDEFARRFADALRPQIQNVFHLISLNFYELGRNMVRSLADGFNSGIGWVVDSARRAAEEALNAARNMLGIHSPSRAFMEIGRQMQQGMSLGFSRPGLGLNMPSMAMAGGGASLAASGGGGVVVNIHYAPAISTADRLEAETKLKPLVEEALRGVRR